MPPELDVDALLRGLDRSGLGIALYDPTGSLHYANPAQGEAPPAAAQETHFDGWRLLLWKQAAAGAGALAAPAPADDSSLRRIADAVEDARARRRPFTLAVLALDEAVDPPALRGFARHCQAHLRPADHLLPGPGGNFLLLLPGAGAHMAASVVQRLRFSLRLSPAAGGHADPHTTFGAGLAELSDRESADELLQRAGQALDGARRKGRNASLLAPPRT